MIIRKKNLSDLLSEFLHSLLSPFFIGMHLLFYQSYKVEQKFL